MNLLVDMAADLGVTIEYAQLKGRDGEYRHDLRRIRLREGMTHRRTRSVLAHEVAHAVFGDVPSKFGPVNAKQERRADEWAALRLIRLDDYREAEMLREGHAVTIAYDLCVTTQLVVAYQRVLLRTERDVYVRPRMGAGMWDHKEQVA